MPGFEFLDAKNAQPAIGGATVAPADGADLARAPTRALYVGVAGDVKVDMADGTTVIFGSVPAGTLLPVAVKRVYATGTTATTMLALY